MTDGNCGLNAFWKSVPEKLRASRTVPWTELSKRCRESGEHGTFRLLRTLATTWIRNNAAKELWEGTTITNFIRATTSESLETYLTNMGKMGAWADTAFLHGLACSCSVDIIIFQELVDPTLVGISLSGELDARAMVPIALVNGLHFWAMQPSGGHMVVVDKGDRFLAGAVLPEHMSGTGTVLSQKHARTKAGTVLPQHEEEEEFEERTPCRDEVQIDVELSLCNALIKWSPFTSPDRDILDAMEQLSAVRQSLFGRKEVTADAVLARQHAIRQLASESEAVQALPPEKRLNRAMTYLKNMGSITALDKRDYLASAADINHSCNINNIQDVLAKPCWKNSTPHACLDAFKDNPQAVRNWRILWHSLPRSTRSEQLALVVKQFKDSGMMTFLGIRVCQKAFTMLAGVGSSSLMAARGMASTGHVRAIAGKELLGGALIKPTNKDPKYVDAREWLEVYAERHAEQSPMTGAFMLPAGRKVLYWLQYVHERLSEPEYRARIGDPASRGTFMKAWNRECPHIVVSKSLTMFTRCGLCEFLQGALARCPRSDPASADMLKRRLGQHYEFQAAQRLAMGRIEEQCRRSGGAEWFDSWPQLPCQAAVAPEVAPVAVALPGRNRSWCLRLPKVFQDRQDGPKKPFFRPCGRSQWPSAGKQEDALAANMSQLF